MRRTLGNRWSGWPALYFLFAFMAMWPLGGRAAESPVTHFSLSAPASGTVPFTVGLSFKKGQVTTHPVLDLPEHQVVVMRRWNDDSVKHAIASGHAALTANVARTVNVSAGTPLTAASIAAANPQASVQLGAIGTVHLSNLLASPIRTFVSGPEMVEAHYRANVGGDATLQVYFHVRLYKQGGTWVRAIIENAYLDVATTEKTYQPTVTIGGTLLFNNGGSPLRHFAHASWSTQG